MNGSLPIRLETQQLPADLSKHEQTWADRMNLASILVASGARADAELAANSLRGEFKNVEISWRTDSALADFERCKPAVLVLAFRDLGEAERHYAALCTASLVSRAHPHRTLVLCRTEDVSHAYALCKAGAFDDYAQFWPMSFDALRLPMSVLHAVRNLRIASALQNSASELMAHASRVVAIDPFLTQALADGEQRVARTADAVHAFDRQFGALADAAGANVAIGPDAAERCGAAAQTLVDQVEALAKWSAELRRHSEPHLQAVRAMQRATLSRPKVPSDTDKPARLSVLIVDDDEFQQKVLRRLVAQANLDCEVVGTGAAALESIRTRPPALVLLDYVLPDTDGLALLRRVRSTPELAALPVIMLTGNGDKQIVVASMLAGANDFMVKPINAERLREKLLRYAVPVV